MAVFVGDFAFPWRAKDPRGEVCRELRGDHAFVVERGTIRSLHDAVIGLADQIAEVVVIELREHFARRALTQLQHGPDEMGLWREPDAGVVDSGVKDARRDGPASLLRPEDASVLLRRDALLPFALEDLVVAAGVKFRDFDERGGRVVAEWPLLDAGEAAKFLFGAVVVALMVAEKVRVGMSERVFGDN